MVTDPRYTRFLLASLVVISLFFVSLLTPNESYAGPPLGFTPTPTPQTTSPDDTGSPNNESGSPDSVIHLQLGCQLICDANGQPMPVQIDVQLIHPGSGWIAEGTISNQSSTTFQVPYPDSWEVHMTSHPILASSENVTSVDSVPRIIGLVDANSGLQIVQCPISCIPPEIPVALPQTGSQTASTFSSSRNVLTSGWLILAFGVGLALVEVYHRRKKMH